MRLLIGGPANSGKSTLTIGLQRILSERGFKVCAHEIDPYSDTHKPLTGQKPWESRQKNYGATVHDIRDIVSGFASDPSRIVLGDLPGNIRNQHLPLMMSEGTHAIYVGHTDEELKLWLDAFRKARVDCLGIVQTTMYGATPAAWTQPADIVVYNLDRTIRPHEQGIGAVADFVLSHL